VSTPNLHPGISTSQRRSQRILLCVGIVVQGKQVSGNSFSEHATTEVVSAHGALILLREPVVPGQKLTLKNILTKEEIACTVIEVNQGRTGVREIGVEFAHPYPRFWRVQFPPEDWSPRSPEAKRFKISTNTPFKTVK
jgi:PilZ domain